MKLSALAASSILASCTIACGPSARADVGWEHTATVRVSTMKQPIVNLKIYNHWTPQRHRLLLRYDFNAMPGGMKRTIGTSALSALSPSTLSLAEDGPALSSSPKNFGGAALIQRLDDDRIVAYETQTRSYINEAFRPLLTKLRFDPWKKLAPELSGKTPPALSAEQRARLGAEIRALAAPFLKRVSRTYFRELPNTRTFNGIEGRGYRFTWLMNVGGIGRGQEQWIRINYEWWLAGDLEGDDTLRQYRTAWINNLKDTAWPSTSMWINEFRPVLMYSLPEKFLRAAETLVPPESAPRAGFGGTPLRIYVTMVPPPLQRSQVGDIRAEIALIRRDRDAVPDRLFEAPEGYKHVPINPEKLSPILNGDVFGRLQSDLTGRRAG